MNVFVGCRLLDFCECYYLSLFLKLTQGKCNNSSVLSLHCASSNKYLSSYHLFFSICQMHDSSQWAHFNKEGLRAWRKKKTRDSNTLLVNPEGNSSPLLLIPTVWTSLGLQLDLNHKIPTKLQIVKLVLLYCLGKASVKKESTLTKKTKKNKTAFPRVIN